MAPTSKTKSKKRRGGGLLRLFGLGPSTKPDRSAASYVERAGLPGYGLPHGTEWAWRPNLWALSVCEEPKSIAESGTNVSADAAAFHDATEIDAKFLQVASQRPADETAPFSLDLHVGRFEGTFISLVIETPPSSIDGIGRKDLVGVALDISHADSMSVYLRYNLRHGPNTETQLRQLPPEGADGRQTVEFDMAYMEMNEKRVESAWVDVIFQAPAETHTTIRDLVMYRRPRASL